MTFNSPISNFISKTSEEESQKKKIKTKNNTAIECAQEKIEEWGISIHTYTGKWDHKNVYIQSY